MHRFQLMLVIILLAASLAGCGQKGPLYQESPAQESPEPSEQDDSRAD